MKIIAHRGASGEFIENSLLAFEQAIKQNCDAIEFDVQYHQASGEFILLHDSYLPAHTSALENNKNKNWPAMHFNRYSLAELTSQANPGYFNIITLLQALQCINQQCQINIELKSSAQGRQLTLEIENLTKIIQLAQQQGLICYSQLVISSFNHHALVAVNKHLPQVTTGALIACCPIDYAKFCQSLPVKLLNISIECINKEIIDDAHQRDLKVWVYTVDYPEQIMQCLALKVDGIFTNYPLRSRLTIEKVNSTT